MSTPQPLRCPACGRTQWVVTITARMLASIVDGVLVVDGSASPPERSQPTCGNCGREHPMRIRM